MSDETLRMRLEALNRGPMAAGVRVAARGVAPMAAEAAMPSVDSMPPAAWRPGVVRAMPGLVRRGDLVRTEAGEHLRVLLPLESLWPGGEELVRQRCDMLCGAKPASGGGGGSEVGGDWWSPIPQAAAFVDLETCGLAGSALFLAGLLRPVDGRLAVELLLARDYSEEPAVLASLWQRLAGTAAIVTFNGKSFDWPMIVDRSRRHLQRPAARPFHVDLLHLSRRRWKRQLPDCKLQTLERHVCGRLRNGDMPSNQIPAAYQHFVRTGFEREMDAILLHNAIDLVTMLDLAMRLAG